MLKNFCKIKVTKTETAYVIALTLKYFAYNKRFRNYRSQLLSNLAHRMKGEV